MAAFSSNIDITSGGTYAMDVTNGETSSKVATDLNGKFANIQELLQNGLPEVWTGDSLPDSLPNGKLIEKDDNLYYGINLTQLGTYKQFESVYAIANITTGTYNGNGESSRTISLNFTPKAVLVIPSIGAISDLARATVYGGMALLDNDVKYGSDKILSIVDNGFIAYGYKTTPYGANTNHINIKYYYLAFRQVFT